MIHTNSRHLGRFEVNMALLTDLHDESAALAVFKDLVVLNAQPLPDRPMIRYLASSRKHFRALASGEPVPEYESHYGSLTGTVTWTEAAPRTFEAAINRTSSAIRQLRATIDRVIK